MVEARSAYEPGPTFSFFAELIRAWTWRGEALRVEVEIAQDVAREPHRVGLVVDREARRVPEPFGVAAEDAHARGVERGDPHLLGDGSHQRADALFHLVGGLVGEGDGQDLERRDVLLSDEPGDAMGEDARLAGAGTRHHQLRTAAVGDRVFLGGVQPLEQVGHGGPTLPGGCGSAGRPGSHPLGVAAAPISAGRLRPGRSRPPAGSVAPVRSGKRPGSVRSGSPERGRRTG